MYIIKIFNIVQFFFLIILNIQQTWMLFFNSDSLKSRHEVLIDEKDPDFGLTAMHYAARNDHLPVVLLLLSYNADINARTPDGRTCLHLASAYSSKELVYELLGRILLISIFLALLCILYNILYNFDRTIQRH